MQKMDSIENEGWDSIDVIEDFFKTRNSLILIIKDSGCNS